MSQRIRTNPKVDFVLKSYVRYSVHDSGRAMSRICFGRYLCRSRTHDVPLRARARSVGRRARPAIHREMTAAAAATERLNRPSAAAGAVGTRVCRRAERPRRLMETELRSANHA